MEKQHVHVLLGGSDNSSAFLKGIFKVSYKISNSYTF